MTPSFVIYTLSLLLVSSVTAEALDGRQVPGVTLSTSSAPPPTNILTAAGIASSTFSSLTPATNIVTKPSSSASSTGSQDSSPTASAESVPQCHASTGALSPICQPTNNTSVYVNATYYVTWDTSFFSTQNSTIAVEVGYANASTLEGESVFISSGAENSIGHVDILMRDSWLRGQLQNPLTFYIAEVDATSKSNTTILRGPTVVLMEPPASIQTTTMPTFTSSPSPKPSHKSNHLGLVVGLSAGLAILLLILFAIYYRMRLRRQRKMAQKYSEAIARKYRADGVSAERPSLSQSHTVRSQRRDLAPSPVHLAEMERAHIDSHFSYRREEERGRAFRHLVGGAERSNNAFRDEVARQKNLR